MERFTLLDLLTNIYFTTVTVITLLYNEIFFFQYNFNMKI